MTTAEAEYRAALQFVIDELSEFAGIDRMRIVARCKQALQAAASEDGPDEITVRGK